MEPADQTWTRFKTEFSTEYHEQKEQRKLTAEGIIFRKANSVVTNPPNSEIATDLENLSLAAVNDRQMMQKLITANKTLIANNKTLTEKITTAVKAFTNLTTNNRNLPPPDPKGYCWMHGYIVSPGHSRKSCTNKAEGHKDEETRANIMGGSDKNKDWKQAGTS